MTIIIIMVKHNMITQLIYIATILSIAYAKTATIFLNVPESTQQSVFSAALDVSNPDSQNYGKYFSSEELAQFVNVPDGNFVTNFLDQHKTLTYSNYGDSIEVFGITDDVSKILGNIPSEVLTHIYFIEGLNDVDRNKFKFRHGKNVKNVKNTVADSGYVGRETIARLYNISMDLFVNTSSSVALIEFSDGGFSRNDFIESLKLNNVKSSTSPIIIGNDNESGTESSLDVQMAAIVAANVTLWYIDYDDTQWIASFAVNVSNMMNPPHVCSVSYGWSSFYQCQIVSCGNRTSEQYVKLSNYHLAKLVLRGITVLVSSGDSGSPSRANEMCNEVPTVQAEFPSASPWVLSVGGVFIVNDTSNLKNSDDDYYEGKQFLTPFCQKYQCASGSKTMIVENKYVGWESGSGFTRVHASNQDKP
jgi:tripeptidyl-peptidase-1